MKILVTGGLGFIGSHTCCELLDEGYEVVVVDNLSNSKIDIIDKIKSITGKDIVFYKDDVCDEEAMDKVFSEQSIDAVIHFAAYKAVNESVKEPIMYYQNNLGSTLNLCKVMQKHNCKKIVFSSSAAVYGLTDVLPVKEDSPLSTLSPYASTKLMNEEILKDIACADPEFSVVILRYFNPVGAHQSYLIGETLNGIPSNLMPYIVKVATGELEVLSVFGDDYDTHDGTGVRDFIHIVDLAKGHLKAIEKVGNGTGISYFNLGTGTGYSVLDLVKAFEKINNVKVPYKIVARREGDIAASYADPTKAYEELGWKAEKTIEDMCKDSYNFVVNQTK